MNKSYLTWEKLELSFRAQQSYQNPYTQVEMGVLLKGPDFEKKVYGFWDGDDRFLVRITATTPGQWQWESFASTNDPGLCGKSGQFTAVAPTDTQLAENPCLRGMVVASENGHGFCYSDGTPYLLLGDTWWATPTDRYLWHEDDLPRPVGPQMGFKDMVRYRKEQGYNCIALLVGHPTWANDGLPPTCYLDDPEQTPIRNAWQQCGTDSAKDMTSDGERLFQFPGTIPGWESVVPDFNRINPAYFAKLDKKIDYLNAMGFTPFIEVARRDISKLWKKYGDWPTSYTRYIQYVFSRYQANNCLLSPIHFDYEGYSIPSREYNQPANDVIAKYGFPPFGTLLSANASPSTLANFGEEKDCHWLTFHQTGNWREHEHYWYLTEIFEHPHPKPAINGEPYYPGFPDDQPPANSTQAQYNTRSALYGSFLSGGLGGFIYGIEGMWGGDVEAAAPYKTWEALVNPAGGMVGHLPAFIQKLGARYLQLIPNAELLTPNKSGDARGYSGWSFAAATPEKDACLCYFEQGCPTTVVRGLLPNTRYQIDWFNPITGRWIGDVRMQTVKSDQMCRITLPGFLGDQDWGLYLGRAADQ